ncbi:MAG: hypothetical protein BGO98_40165 [Myxococcales bacterium 68-20]|nr:hypothetical protein [Myxococcales bacterium]OJY16204.1 MAG: hypothetical protein BGO98_40165 [Myxococcales bacterium 68-20]
MRSTRRHTEIKFGDNDQLRPRVASTIGADMLVLLSDVDGLYYCRRSPGRSDDPYPRSRCHHGADATGSVIGMGEGGMVSKIIAAPIATGTGCNVEIAKAEAHPPLMALTEGGRHTLFRASLTPAIARKRWDRRRRLGHARRSTGSSPRRTTS